MDQQNIPNVLQARSGQVATRQTAVTVVMIWVALGMLLHEARLSLADSGGQCDTRLNRGARWAPADKTNDQVEKRRVSLAGDPKNCCGWQAAARRGTVAAP